MVNDKTKKRYGTENLFDFDSNSDDELFNLYFLAFVFLFLFFFLFFLSYNFLSCGFFVL